MTLRVRIYDLFVAGLSVRHLLGSVCTMGLSKRKIGKYAVNLNMYAYQSIPVQPRSPASGGHGNRRRWDELLQISVASRDTTIRPV